MAGEYKTRVTGNAKSDFCILTIGHSNRTWEEFLTLLQAHGVERIVDVRTIPRSRHNPQFDKANFSRSLCGARISYIHLKLLGGLRHPLKNSVNLGWRNAGFRGFADYMQTPEFEAGLARLLSLASEKRCAILCAEAVPWRCHRSLIADALTVRRIPVFHIMSRTRREPHSLTPFAHVHGEKITYPVSVRDAEQHSS